MSTTQTIILFLLGLIAVLLTAIVGILAWLWLNVFKKGLGLKIEIESKKSSKPS